MIKKSVYELISKIVHLGEDTESVLIKTKSGHSIFTTIKWLKLEYNVECLTDMPNIFMVAEDENSPVYFMDYEEISYIRC